MATKATSDSLYILHSRPYQNTSMLIDAFSYQHGRIALIAKGARREKSPFYAQLQLFIKLSCSWGGRGEIYTLFKCEPEKNQTAIPASRYFHAIYLNELLVKLLHDHDVDAELFEYYEKSLSAIASKKDIEPSLRYFELFLLECLGYGLNLSTETDAVTGIERNKQYTYLMEQGFVEKTHANDDTVFSGDSLIELSNSNLQTEKQKKDAKKLLRKILEFYLGRHEIKTSDIFTYKIKSNG